MKLKPYPKFKDSGVPWLGDVPEHWEVRKITHLFRKIGSGTTPNTASIDYYEGNIPWIISGDLTDGFLNATKKKITAKALQDYPTLKIYPEDSLVIAMYGATIGKVSLTTIRACTNQACCVLSYPHNIIDMKFMLKLFISIKPNLVKMGYGGGQPNISQDTIKSLRLPIPPLIEQQQIARYLDWKTAQINKFIRNKRRLIQLLKEQKQNIINQAVTKGINPNVEMKDSGVEWLGQIPKHWEVRKLKTIAKVKASGVDKHSRENEIPIQLCNYTDVYKNDKITDSMDFMKATATKEEISNFELVAGDVIITKDSEIWDDIAVPAYVPNSLQNVICAYHLSLIRPRQEYIKGDFLYHCFLAPSLAYQFKVTATGVTRFGLSQGTIKSALFPVPPNSEQQEIIAYIEKETALIDKTISRTEREIELIQEYRSRIVSDVVTGKLDVRGIEIPDFEPVEADLELEEDEESEGEEIDEDE